MLTGWISGLERKFVLQARKTCRWNDYILQIANKLFLPRSLSKGNGRQSEQSTGCPPQKLLFGHDYKFALLKYSFGGDNNLCCPNKWLILVILNINTWL